MPKLKKNKPPPKKVHVPLKVDNYTLGSPDFAEPTFSRFWTDEQLGKWLVFAGQLRAYFTAEVTAGRGRQYIKWKERVAYIKTLAAPADCKVRKVPGNFAEMLASSCWDKSWGKGEDDE